MENDIEQELIALNESVGNVSHRATENQKEVGALTKAIDGVIARADKFDNYFKSDKAKIEALEIELAKQKSLNDKQQNDIEKLERTVTQLGDRLDGKSQYGVGGGTTYEKAVATLSNLVDRLSGGQEGQISYEAVRGSIQKTQFLGQVLYGAIGVFGVGAVIAAGRTFLGGPEDLSPAVQLIQKQVEANTDNISRLDSRVTADERVEQKRRIEVLENRLFEKRIKD